MVARYGPAHGKPEHVILLSKGHHLLRDGRVGCGLQQDDAAGGGERQPSGGRLCRHHHDAHLRVPIERAQRLADGLRSKNSP